MKGWWSTLMTAFCGIILIEPTLEIRLIGALRFEKYLSKSVQKLKTRNKLNCLSWGALENALSSLSLSTLLLVPSTKGHCALIWGKVTTCEGLCCICLLYPLSCIKQWVSGAVMSIPSRCLPIFSNVLPPELRRFRTWRVH